MVVLELPIASLKEYGQNSRKHGAAQVKQIAASITEFGWTNPVLIDEHGVLIAGHGRLAAAKLLGMETVHCIEIAGLSEDKRRALVIADNQLATNAGWDEEILASELALLKNAGYELDLLGFAATEVNHMLDVRLSGKTAPDAVPATPSNPITAVGDIWQLGVHRVMCGDSTTTETVNALMGGGVSRPVTD